MDGGSSPAVEREKRLGVSSQPLDEPNTSHWVWEHKVYLILATSPLVLPAISRNHCVLLSNRATLHPVDGLLPRKVEPRRFR